MKAALLWILGIWVLYAVGTAWDAFAPKDSSSVWMPLLVLTFWLGTKARERLSDHAQQILIFVAFGLFAWRLLGLGASFL